MTASIPIDKPNATSAMTKEDFLVEKSGSSTSPASDPAQKLTKKQARKRARENRKNQADNVSTEHDDDKVARKIAEVTLQTEASNRKQSVEIGIPDEKRPNAAAHVNSHPSIYRRHLSESHADLDNSSNGEFKLKVGRVRCICSSHFDCVCSSLRVGHLEKVDEIALVLGVVQ